jgi:hypothetical protein
MNILLAGTVGSTAYGLNTAGSDIDTLGMYAAPATAFHGLHPPVGRDATIVRNNPDATFHEAGRYCALALSCNPTVVELMWLPAYTVRTRLGDDLIGIRGAFPTARRVRDAYLGYAASQIKRLSDRGDGSFSADTRRRTTKHARHLMRLCHQGLALYTTGTLPVRVDRPELFHEFGERVAGGDVQAARDLIAAFEGKFDHARTVLPDRPNEAAVERWLQAVRHADLEVDPVMLGHYPAALDALYQLRRDTAVTARYVERVAGQYRSMPERARAALLSAVDDLRAAARGRHPRGFRSADDEAAMKAAGVPLTLTRWAWEHRDG